jgi:hypothetical protein
MTTNREQFELWFRKRWPEFEHPTNSAWEAWEAGAAAEREACASICEHEAEHNGLGAGWHLAVLIRERGA